jgi:uncharacterized protein YbjT (DUF2867 family)
MRRVLVAGATGYLGGYVVRELKAQGYFVRALARSPAKADSLHGVVDEVHVGQVTERETLSGGCDGMDVVFSSIGITRQRDGLTFRDVDFQGNRNLLETARQAGVRKFVYVSIMDGTRLRHLDIVKAHEDFVDVLARSGLAFTVVRPTGYFSDMEEIFTMAFKGRVFLFGDGSKRTNPIHGADLAKRCIDAIDCGETEIEIGGPEVLTWREIANVAFAVQDKRPKITTIPLWVVRPVISVMQLLNRHQAELLAFFSTMATRDVIGPANGSRTLQAHFLDLANRR